MLKLYSAPRTRSIRIAWLLGSQFTAADIMMGFTIMAANLLGIVKEDSDLGHYLDRLQGRPAFQVAFDKTGGFG